MKRAALCLLILAAWMAPAGAWARRAVLVELFTAQGCASCAKANALLGRLADRPGVIVLTWSVDYWDYLGWKDTFAEPEFTDRQRAYDRRFGLRNVYTPQVIVGGGAQTSGDKAAAVDALIAQAKRTPVNSPDMAILTNGRLAIGSGPRPRGGAEVWLIRYDPKDQQVEVKGGDNRGATVPYRNVVREVARLGAWSGRPVVFKHPLSGEENLSSLILVQGTHGGRILGVFKAEAAKP